MVSVAISDTNDTLTSDVVQLFLGNMPSCNIDESRMITFKLINKVLTLTLTMY